MSVYPVLLVTFAFVFSGVNGHASGAGNGACEESTMMPRHPGVAAMTGASPYTISLSATEYNPGDSVVVTLQGADPLVAFLVLALPEDNPTGSAIGSFDVNQDGTGTALSQDRCNGGTTHTLAFNGLNVNSIELTWKAPTTGDLSNITFYATFAAGYDVFYVKKPSEVLTSVTTVIPGPVGPPGPAPDTTTTAAADTTTTTTTTTVAAAEKTTSGGTTQQSTIAVVVFSTMMWLILKYC